MNGNLYVLYNANPQQIRKYDPNGNLICTLNLVNIPTSFAGGGFSIVNGFVFAAINMGNTVFKGTVSGNTVTFTTITVNNISSSGDMASCTIGVGNAGNLSGLQDICVGDTTTFSSTISGGIWSTSDSTIATIDSITGFITGISPGTATITYTDTSGSGAGLGVCSGSSTATRTITVHASYNDTFNVAICAGQTYTLPDGSTVSASGTYMDTVPSVFGCDSMVTTILSINPLPSATVASNSPLCEGDSLNLQSSGGTTYSWNGPNGFTSSQQNPTINPADTANSGIYTIVVTDANGCADTATVSVTVNPAPNASAASNSPICEGDSLLLSANGGGNYAWIGPSGFSETSQSPFIAGATTTNAGQYIVTVSNQNCATTDTVNVVIYAKPKADIAGGDNGCVTSQVQFSDSSSIATGSIVGLHWSFYNSNFSDSSTLDNPLINFPGNGTYQVQLIVTSNQGCTDTATTTVQVYPLPIADFIYDANCFGITGFTAIPTENNNTNQWDLFNDQTIDTTIASFIYDFTISNDTTIEVLLAVTDSNGCKADTVKNVMLKGGLDTLIMPNILILNSSVPGNEKLDFTTFAPGFNRCVSYTLRIFNRWGNIVYDTKNETSNPDLSCNECFVGKSQQGAVLSDGTYYYVLTGTDIKDKKYVYNGVLQIINSY